MGLLGGKNSPQTSQATSTTTTNTEIAPTITAGSGSSVTQGPTLSDVSNTGGITFNTTDEGAVQGGLALASQALDSASSNDTALLQSANQVEDASNSLATTVAQGQQNTSLKYLLYAAVAVVGLVGAVYIFKKR